MRTGSEINICKELTSVCFCVTFALTHTSGGATKDQEEEEEQHQKEASAGTLGGGGASKTLSGQQLAGAQPRLAGGPPF